MTIHIVIDSSASLRTKAIEAFDAMKKNNEIHADKEKDDRSQKASAAFVKWFGIEPDFVDGYLVVSGDIELSFEPESWSADFGKQYEGWHVVGLCSLCDEKGAVSVVWRSGVHRAIPNGIQARLVPPMSAAQSHKREATHVGRTIDCNDARTHP